MVRKLYDDPVEEIQKKMVGLNVPALFLPLILFQTGGSEPVVPSVVASALEEAADDQDPVQLHDIKGVAATMYAAGVDTVPSILFFFCPL